ncbi:hypothetical protein N5V81_13790 [Escherichia coli]|nr:hypothetical protein [Escherichia coli]
MKFNSTTKPKLVIYNLPREQAAHIDRTTDIAGNVIYLICGGDTSSLEYRDQAALNHGTGYRVGSGTRVDGRSSSFTPGDISMTTPDKFVAQADPAAYPGGAWLTHQSILINTLVILINRSGLNWRWVWHDCANNLNRSTHGILYPGMPVKTFCQRVWGLYPLRHAGG